MGEPGAAACDCSPCSAVSSSGKPFPGGRLARSQNKIFRSFRDAPGVHSMGEDGKSAPQRTFAWECRARGRGRGGAEGGGSPGSGAPGTQSCQGSSPLGGEGGGARAECRKRAPGTRKQAAGCPQSPQPTGRCREPAGILTAPRASVSHRGVVAIATRRKSGPGWGAFLAASVSSDRTRVSPRSPPAGSPRPALRSAPAAVATAWPGPLVES